MTKINATQRDRAGTLGELLRVSVPLILSSGSAALMYVIDRIFLSWDSVESVAAVLPASVLHWNLAALALGMVSYVNVFVGQYEGAGQSERIGAVLWQGIYLAFIAAVVILAFCLPMAPTIFAWFGHDAVVQDLELRFFRIACWSSFPLLLATTLSCFYSGRGKTLVIMVIDILGTMINVGLDYVLILGKFGFPRMGIDGAALATAVAFISIALMYIFWMVRTERRSPYGLWAGRRFDRELFFRLLRFGFPSGLQQFLDVACWTVFVQLVGRLGTEKLSATSLVFNLNTLVFIPLLGLGTAVMALTGQRIGEGRLQLAVRTTWLAFGVACVYVAVFCGVYLFAPELILSPYGLGEEHQDVRELVVHLLRFVAVYSWFDAMFVVFSAAIRGAGDTRFALVLSVSLGVTFLVLPTYIASLWGPEGFSLAWYAVTLFVTVLGLAFLARFVQGRWKTMRVIEHTAAELGGPHAEAFAAPVAASS